MCPFPSHLAYNRKAGRKMALLLFSWSTGLGRSTRAPQ